ncbi:MAG: creatininase family protein [Betaproteobacteria bacterium]|jgi:creatinine amidohydrolase|nr:MAG: creatininase family protein [Betaproteobacteria bacterium]
MYLSDLTWLQAKQELSADTLILIPLGAAAKEHGPHLRLDNDRVLADYLTARVVEQADVVVAPTLTYHFYPAFTAYAGSTTLRLETARDMVIDVITSLATFGPRRFYILNTGVSTVRALEPAAAWLAAKGILLRFTRIDRTGNEAVQRVQEQPGGTHADEIETSMMLYIVSERVDMSKAQRDYHPGSGPLSPDSKTAGVYSPTGIYGDATLASVEKGRIVVEATVIDLLRDIAMLRDSPLPANKAD